MTSGDRVIGYVRVSTADQGSSGLGLEAQRQAIQAECRRRGWELIRIEEDVQSGRSTRNRPGLTRARAACRAGEAVGIVFAKLDRATRSLADFAKLVEEAERGGYSLVATDGSCDMTNPMGRAMAGMAAVFSQLERDLISERTKLAMAVVQKRGTRSGKPIGRPRVLDDQLRRRVRRLHRSGVSLSEIARRLNSEGVATAHGAPQWWPSTVRALVV